MHECINFNENIRQEKALLIISNSHCYNNLTNSEPEKFKFVAADDYLNYHYHHHLGAFASFLDTNQKDGLHTHLRGISSS